METDVKGHSKKLCCAIINCCMCEYRDLVCLIERPSCEHYRGTNEIPDSTARVHVGMYMYVALCTCKSPFCDVQKVDKWNV